ncbi:hypothetical protein Fmac_014601 [Flemingia macrophylla]|uniref:Protein kinase domain-containing protein n=1 Tax=Flemingia macrophylla TaxID=520843 RepID=A0ABD1MC70_9FABA
MKCLYIISTSLPHQIHALTEKLLVSAIFSFYPLNLPKDSAKLIQCSLQLHSKIHFLLLSIYSFTEKFQYISPHHIHFHTFLDTEISIMANSASGFTWAVDSAIRSCGTTPNLGASRVHSFTSAVENALSSINIGGDLSASHSFVHGFASGVDRAISSIVIGGDFEATSVHGFTWEVDNAIRSTIGGYLGADPVHGFHSGVDNAIRSTTGGYLGADPVHGFDSVVDNEIHSVIGGDLEAPPMHGFASGVDNVMSDATGDKDFQLFTLAELVKATNNFSFDNMIGVGNFGGVHRGKLVDGREVAIKRVETDPKMKWLQEVGLAYLFTFLSGPHHEHFVGLVGFCKEKDERLLVYEYMRNGSLYDHLHHKGSSVLNSWRMRIKIALDASRGIEYLHGYEFPHIIHRNIKSSNILLDATWTARVADFGWTFVKKTTGTAGYVDPEYHDLNVLTVKSDVYGFGIVLLELLTGKRPIFNHGEDGGTLLSVVDFAGPDILAREWMKILDPSVGPPNVNEAKAVELMAYTAIKCVNLKGKDRPTMLDVVNNLSRALAICEKS